MPYKDIEKRRECNNRYVVRHPERVKQSKENYAAANPEKVKESKNKYYHTNKEQERAKCRARYHDGRRIKDWLVKHYETQSCIDCTRVFPYCAMEFDHKGDEPKEFCISQMNTYVASSKNIAKVMKEISKCDFVCACCHKVRTWERLQ